MGFERHPCFTTDVLVQSKRGPACHALSDAMKPFPEAQPVRNALGECCLPEKRAMALRLLRALPQQIQDAIAAAEGKLLARRRKSTEQAGEANP